MALLYALGHENYLQTEGIIPESESSETMRDLFVRWLDQPANDDLPEQPEFLLGEKILLRSFVLGCEVIVDATNTTASLYLAETILGALEAFLATGLDTRILPYRSQLKINIAPSDFVEDYHNIISMKTMVVKLYQFNMPETISAKSRIAMRFMYGCVILY